MEERAGERGKRGEMRKSGKRKKVGERRKGGKGRGERVTEEGEEDRLGTANSEETDKERKERSEYIKEE